MRRLHLSRIIPLTAAAALVLAAAACSSGSSPAAGGGAPEIGTVTVDSLDSQDAAALWIAEKDGYFRQQGLTVKVTYVPSTNAAAPGLLARTVDFSMENYVGALEEEAKTPQLGLRFIVDDLQAAANTTAIMVAKNSPVKSLSQLKGKTVAFPSAALTVGSLEFDEQLRGYGLGPGAYTDEGIGFADMIAPLERGEIAAAFSIQPFITIMESQIGARVLLDFNTGSTASFPSTAWATTLSFQQKYPRTVAAFQRAMEKATQVAASGQQLVRQLMAQNIKGLTPQLANVVALQDFNTTLSVTRVQRVADTMEEFGALPRTFNVKPMIVPLPPGA